MIELKVLSESNKQEIKTLFTGVFSREPWNDDWSNEKQLEKYITGIIGNRDSLTLGLVKDDTLIGISLGNLIHWYKGTEYYIREFCVSAEAQGKGMGSNFLSLIEEYLKKSDVHTIFLNTDRSTPAYSFYKKNNFSELESERFLFKNF